MTVMKFACKGRISNGPWLFVDETQSAWPSQITFSGLVIFTVKFTGIKKNLTDIVYHPKKIIKFSAIFDKNAVIRPSETTGAGYFPFVAI